MRVCVESGDGLCLVFFEVCVLGWLLCGGFSGICSIVGIFFWCLGVFLPVRLFS